MAINDWLDMATSTVDYYAKTGNDAYGKPTYGTAVSYNARVVEKPTRVMTISGNEVTARGVVWLIGAPSVDPEDKITLPDGTSPTILASARYPDELGNHHTKIFFGGV